MFTRITCFLLPICLSVSLIGSTMLQDSQDESESYEKRDPQFSAEQILKLILDQTNDYFQRSALNSIPINEKQNGTYYYGSKVWGMHLGYANGEVKYDASVIVVYMTFPYLQFTLFADAGYDEGIVSAKVYDLDVRSVVYFNEYMNTYHYMDTYVHGYRYLSIQASGNGRKNNLKVSVDQNTFLNILKESFNEVLKVFDYFKSAEKDYKLRYNVKNGTDFQDLKVTQTNEM